jgi:methylmalonyl-CoA epimerase
MIQGLDHIGIAVSDLETAIELWTQVVSGKMVHRERIESQKVEVAVIEVGALQIELLCPTSEDSPVAKFIAARGTGIHHLALLADSAQTELDRLAENDIKLIDRTTRHGAHNSNVGFLHPRAMNGVLLEFVDHANDH